MSARTPEAPDAGLEVTVFKRRSTKAWRPGLEPSDKARGRVHRADWAFQASFWSDAHFSSCIHPDGWRFGNDSLPHLSELGVFPEIRLIAFDFDAHHIQCGQDEWKGEFFRQVASLPKDEKGRLPFAYYTRNGGRIVYRLASPFVIRDERSAYEWRRFYLSAAVGLWHHAGLEADAACSDFGRLFRLPFVIRDFECTAPDFRPPSKRDLLVTDPRTIATLDLQAMKPTDGRTFEQLEQRSIAWRGARRVIFGEPPRPETSLALPAITPVTQIDPYDRRDEGALRHAINRIETALPGMRNNALYAMASWLYGERRKHGRFRNVPIEQILSQSARKAGLEAGEIQRSLESALRAARGAA